MESDLVALGPAYPYAIRLTVNAPLTVSAHPAAMAKRSTKARPKVRVIRLVPAPGLKRLTFDLDAELHRALKVHCAERGLRMNDLLRTLIEREVSKR